jgi:hypothetical protein
MASQYLRGELLPFRPLLTEPRVLVTLHVLKSALEHFTEDEREELGEDVFGMSQPYVRVAWKGHIGEEEYQKKWQKSNA